MSSHRLKLLNSVQGWAEGAEHLVSAPLVAKASRLVNGGPGVLEALHILPEGLEEAPDEAVLLEGAGGWISLQPCGLPGSWASTTLTPLSHSCATPSDGERLLACPHVLLVAQLWKETE